MAAPLPGPGASAGESFQGPHTTRHLLAKRLRVLRAVRGWSQETLAEQAGLHRTYIGDIERAERNLGLDNLDKLAQAFGMTVADLLTANPMTETQFGAQNKRR